MRYDEKMFVVMGVFQSISGDCVNNVCLTSVISDELVFKT